MKKSLKTTALLLFFCLLFSGCTPLSINGRNMMSPVALNSEYSAVKEAFLAAVGENVRFLFPKSGDFEEAVAFKDLDGDGADEAVIFYRGVNSGTEARLCVLDKISGQWTAVWNTSTPGYEVDSVWFLSAKDGTSLLAAGYSVQDTVNRRIQVYSYAQENPRVLYDADYIAATPCDFDQNGIDELLLVYNDNGAYFAGHLPLTGAEPAVDSEAYVNDSAAIRGYRSVSFGLASENAPAVFLDGYASSGVLTTEILIMQDGVLENPLFNDEADRTYLTLRTSDLISMDYNGDGITEVPYRRSQADTGTAAQLTLTELKQYQPDEDAFFTVLTGYYDETYRYFLSLPELYADTDSDSSTGGDTILNPSEHTGKRIDFTLEKNDSDGSLTVYPYENNNTNYLQPLFSIRCEIAGASSDSTDLSGWQKAAGNLSCSVYVKIPDSSLGLYGFVTYEELAGRIQLIG